jgi:DNA (cytosine-5)-methyltransferase 1
MSRKLTAIDLFSGCGGFSYGFQQAGFHVLLGVDNTEIALKTFAKNHDNSKTLNLDLHKDEAIDTIVESIEGKEIDVIIGGHPCQGFSLTGTRNENDERNTLFNAMFRLAKKVNPKAIIIENVPGLLKLYNGKALKDPLLSNFHNYHKMKLEVPKGINLSLDFIKHHQAEVFGNFITRKQIRSN